MSARSAAFTTERPGADLVRIATEQDVDLLLVEAPEALLDDPDVQAVLIAAPCDVGLLAGRVAPLGPAARSSSPSPAPNTTGQPSRSPPGSRGASEFLCGSRARSRPTATRAGCSLALRSPCSAHSGSRPSRSLVEPGADGLLAASTVPRSSSSGCRTAGVATGSARCGSALVARRRPSGAGRPPRAAAGRADATGGPDALHVVDRRALTPTSRAIPPSSTSPRRSRRGPCTCRRPSGS